MASTENGIIFGNIVYDVTGSTSDRNVVVLNDIHIDIMDYIVPAGCTDAEFRQMWADFEWENKVTVNTSIDDLNLYLTHLLKYDLHFLLILLFTAEKLTWITAKNWWKSVDVGSDCCFQVYQYEVPDSRESAGRRLWIHGRKSLRSIRVRRGRFGQSEPGEAVWKSRGSRHGTHTNPSQKSRHGAQFRRQDQRHPEIDNKNIYLT